MVTGADSFLSFNRWLPERFQSIEDHGAALRVRIFMVLIILCIGPMLPICLSFIIAAIFGYGILWGPSLVLTLFLTAQGFCLLFFLRTGNIHISSIIYATIIFFLVGTATFYTGGWHSPLCHFLLALPVIACLVISRLSGISYSFGILMLYAAFFLAEQYGYSLPQMLPDRFLTLVTAGMWFTALFFIIGCLLFFDIAANDLSETMKREQEQIEHDLNFDDLTKLHNKQSFIQCIDESKHTHQDDSQCAAIYIFIENLKEINHRYGYDVGDEFLVQLAELIQLNDIDNAIYSHYSPDSFAVFINNFQDIGLIISTIIKIKNNLCEIIYLKDGRPIAACYKVGAAITTNRDVMATELMENAINQSENSDKSNEIYRRI